MKLWYVAHPYTGNIYSNYKTNVIRANKLLDRGFLVFAPIVHSHPLNELRERPPAFWYAQDLEILAKCDGIILCPGWEKSIGCVMEKEFAEKYGLEIKYYDEIMEGIEK